MSVSSLLENCVERLRLETVHESERPAELKRFEACHDVIERFTVDPPEIGSI